MRNAFTVFRQDVRHLFSNVMSIVVTIGLVVLPSLFAWYNVLACWDVFDNTGNLKVAVANADEGYQSDLVPLPINVGNEVVSALRGNDQIGWVFTDADDAVEGAKSGKYYAAVVIPESFSRDMLTFYTEDAQHAKINYYVNEKKNAIAPRITGIGADTVSYEINEEFSNTVSEIALALAQSLSKYAEQGDADGRIAALSGHVRSAAGQLDRTADVVELYSSLGLESQKLVEGSTGLLESQKGVIDSTTATLGSGAGSLKSLASTLATSADDLSKSLEANDAALAQLETSLDGLFDSASGSATASAAALRQSAAGLDSAVSACDTEIAALQQVRALVPEADRQMLDAAIQTKQQEKDLLKLVQTELNGAASSLDEGNADAKERVGQLKSQIADARSQLHSMQEDYNRNVKPSLQGLASNVETLAGDLSKGMEGANALGGGLSGSIEAASGALGQVSGKVDRSASDLREASDNLTALADKLDVALASGDVDALRQILENDVADLAGMLSAPVEVQRHAVFPAESFGSSMSPLYTTLAMFVGSLLIMVAVKPEVSQRARESLDNPKPRQLYFGRFGVVALLSLLQTTLLGLGDLYFLQVQVVHPWLYMLVFWFSGLVFAFIIYTLVVSFANLGKAIAVLMLIIQVTGCGGSYPLQILPGFVQWLSPYLPATHVVNAMRAAMMGLYQNDYWISMAELSLFIVPALLLGLVLRKLVERFMHFYLSKVEDSKMIS